jgi:hypothetical protein
MIQGQNLEISRQFYTEFKFWGPVIGGIWSVFKLVDWFKAIKTDDLQQIKDGIKNFNVQLDQGLQKQTDTIVNSMTVNTNELKELRVDVKMMTSAALTKAARVRKK